MNEIVIGKTFRVDIDPDKKPNLGLDRPYDDDYFIADKKDTKLRFVATMAGGLEPLSAKELEIRFPSDIRLRAGKVHFEAELSDLKKMHCLRSVDNLSVTLADVEFDWSNAQARI